jgi:hypothetical protein
MFVAVARSFVDRAFEPTAGRERGASKDEPLTINLAHFHIVL